MFDKQICLMWNVNNSYFTYLYFQIDIITPADIKSDEAKVVSDDVHV